uniref:YKT6 v-SNARE homolog n=2 Tax=Paramormyrops kingsleyae TaxID=1676925 RepID=A0A3B3R7P2_9TELE
MMVASPTTMSYMADDRHHPVKWQSWFFTLTPRSDRTLGVFQRVSDTDMKLFSLSILYKDTGKAVLLKAAYDLSSFGFFQKSSVQEFMTFTSALVVERSSHGSRASVTEQEYLCHVYVRNDCLSGVVIADSEYPQRVSFTLLDKVLDEFTTQVDSLDWPTGSPDTIRYAALDSYLAKYQNPREADALTKVQAELDETKVILNKTMDSLLERGEKLDDLVAKSEHLGSQSKAFYKTAKKHNSCCKMM